MKKLSDYPEWVAAEQKLAELRDRLELLETRRQELLAESVARERERADARLEAAAEALLESGDVPPKPDDRLKQLRDLQQERRRERDIVEQAVMMHERRMRELCRELSNRITDDNADLHEGLVRTFLEDLIALAKSATELGAFLREAEREGVLFARPSPRFPYGMFDVTDFNSEVGDCVADAIRGGILTGREDFLRGVKWHRNQ